MKTPPWGWIFRTPGVRGLPFENHWIILIENIFDHLSSWIRRQWCVLWHYYFCKRKKERELKGIWYMWVVRSWVVVLHHPLTSPANEIILFLPFQPPPFTPLTSLHVVSLLAKILLTTVEHPTTPNFPFRFYFCSLFSSPCHSCNIRYSIIHETLRVHNIMHAAH